MNETTFTPWAASPTDSELIGTMARAGVTVNISRRPVRDGELVAFVRCEPPHHTWHLSLSHWPKHSRRHRRWPTWDELIEARTELVPGNVEMILHIPTAEGVTANDPTVHIYEYPEHDRIDGRTSGLDPSTDQRVWLLPVTETADGPQNLAYGEHGGDAR